VTNTLLLSKGGYVGFVKVFLNRVPQNSISKEAFLGDAGGGARNGGGIGEMKQSNVHPRGGNGINEVAAGETVRVRGRVFYRVCLRQGGGEN